MACNELYRGPCLAFSYGECNVQQGDRRHSTNNAIYIQAWMNAGPPSTLHWTPRSSGQVSEEKWFVKKLSRASNLPSTSGILNCYEENYQHGCHIGTPDLEGQAEIFLQMWGKRINHVNGGVQGELGDVRHSLLKHCKDSWQHRGDLWGE